MAKGKTKGKTKGDIVCPECGSRRSESHGIRETKSLGLRQRRLCLECGHNFTVQHGGDC
jgi:transposase-like protein